MPELPGISLALAGLDAGLLRDDLRRVSEAGFKGVHLNAAAAGCRPRDFDRSARRDLAASIRRLELRVSGVDLWIPAKHFTDAAHADRAVGATIEATAFAAELAALTGGEALLCVAFPAHDTIPGELHSLTDGAERHGCRLADHRWPPGEAGRVQVGIDPPTVLIAEPSSDPAAAMSAVADRVASVRVADLDGSGRVAPGDGRLDLLSWVVTATTCPGVRDLVVDLRGLARGWEIAPRVRETIAGLTRVG